jgi:hypothetical protein
MLSGKTVLWMARRGQVDDAVRIAKSLMRWQQINPKAGQGRTYGAIPSVIELDDIELDAKGARPGARYYAADNLVILEALLELYAKTGDAPLLNSAIGIGTWITEVMCRGHQYGVWAENHGAPMWFVSAQGDFNNQIPANGEMMWMSALARLGHEAAEPAYTRQAERAYAFHRNAQYGNGAYLDHYDPGWPPKPYDGGRWRPYQAGQLIADSTLRGALGACRAGDLDSARHFFKWLKVEQGGVPAYLDLATGGSGFPKTQEIYYDLTSSALHRSLCQWLGERQAAQQDMAFLKQTQDPTGGWHWGLFAKSLKPVTPQMAPIVGLWATADLSI